MQNTKSESQIIAGTIINQLGGLWKLQIMLGARDIIIIDSGVQFSFCGCKLMNKIVIKLNERDTYDIEFWKVWGLGAKKIISYSDVYCDMIKNIFEDETGLRISL